MHFPVSGVECPVWLPVAAAFVLALVTTPAGVSGAFLLLPFQMTVLGFVSPAVTPTNLIYNVVSIPGGVCRYAREKRVAWPLARLVLAGTFPGVVLGAVIRLRWLPDPRHFKLFVALVLLYLGARLVWNGIRPVPNERYSCHPGALVAVALVVGVAGGIYGVGGGAMIAPFAMTLLRLPAREVAGAALLSTLVTSIVGIVSFELLAMTSLPAGAASRPDWQLGLLFGAGGLFGSYFGAGLQKHLPERFIRLYLGVLLAGLGVAYSVRFFLAGLLLLLCCTGRIAAQCIPDNPGGSRVSANRPADADVPAAPFSPLATAGRALPSWLCFTAGYRARLESTESDVYLLTRFRLGVSVIPLSWLRVYTELQDATVFWNQGSAGPPHQSTWDLRRAYVDFGDAEQKWIGLRVGRQDLSFGHGRLVGTSYWRNASRGWDAAMMILAWGRVKVHTFAASPVIASHNGISHHRQGDNLHGVYASLKDVIPASVLEPYVLWRLAPSAPAERDTPAKLDGRTVGFRWAATVSRFDLETELARQGGAVGPDRLRAWAYSVTLGYTLPFSRATRLFAKHDFASGDRNPHDGVRGTFDQLFPNIHDHHGLADQVAWQNLKSLRGGVRISLRRNWILAAACNEWWLASATDAFYSASGAVVARDTTGLSGTHIGREFDLQTNYRLNRALELGAGFAHIRAGNLLLRARQARAYNYPYLMLNYSLSESARRDRR